MSDYLLRILANSFIVFFFEKQFFLELGSVLSRNYSAILKEEHRKMPETSNNSRHVELSWAGRVRTGNRQSFDYMKDTEVTCRFKEPLLRESIYKEITKTKWPLTRIVGMVLRLRGLVDFTQKTKDLALSFAETLNDLESIRTATAHADTMVEVRIDFIPPRLPLRTHYQLPRIKPWRISCNPYLHFRQV